MSKLYQKYLELKSNQNHQDNTLYLFKSGIFFIFIDEDAKLASHYFHLKLTQLNENIVKCGFPSNSFSKYLGLFEHSPYHVEIVSLEKQQSLSAQNYLIDENIKEIMREIIAVDIDTLSISQAYDFLYHIQSKLSYLSQENKQ